MIARHHLPPRSALIPLALLALLLVLPGCHSTPMLQPANLSEPGWRVQTGQAVWTPRRGAPEIAGEVLLATHPDGRSIVQFTKSPFPIVLARTVSNRWEIQFVPQHRVFNGTGRPAKHFGWLQLAPAVAGRPLPGSFDFSRPTDARWRLENRANGEVLEGYFLP